MLMGLHFVYSSEDSTSVTFTWACGKQWDDESSSRIKELARVWPRVEYLLRAGVWGGAGAGGVFFFFIGVHRFFTRATAGDLHAWQAAPDPVEVLQDGSALWQMTGL